MSHDVDEEAYEGEGDEVSEAREVSDGERRAVADADQVGEPGVSGGTRTPHALRTPESPTDTVRMPHCTTHVPFRDHCPFCGASRARESPHRRVVAEVLSRLHVQTYCG